MNNESDVFETVYGRIFTEIEDVYTEFGASGYELIVDGMSYDFSVNSSERSNVASWLEIVKNRISSICNEDSDCVDDFNDSLDIGGDITIPGTILTYTPSYVLKNVSETDYSIAYNEYYEGEQNALESLRDEVEEILNDIDAKYPELQEYFSTTNIVDDEFSSMWGEIQYFMEN